MKSIITAAQKKQRNLSFLLGHSINLLTYLLIALYFISRVSAQTQLGNNINGASVLDNFGGSVSLSGDGTVLAIGGLGANNWNGHARIFAWDGSAWVQRGSTITGDSVGDQLGRSVSLSNDGNYFAVGAHLNDANGKNSGQVRVYRWTGSFWSQLGGDMNGSANSSFGGKVSLSNDGQKVAVGSPWEFSGVTRVFSLVGNVWMQQGSEIDYENSGDFSGWSISLSGDGNTLAIGAPDNSDNGNEAGHARIYRWDGNAWTKMGSDIDGESAGDEAGSSVSLSDDGNTLAVGAPKNDASGVDAGHVRIYNWNGNAWIQKGVNINGEAAGDAFGHSVSLNNDGSIIAIGAIHNDDGGSAAGHVRIYRWNGNAWVKLTDDIDGTITSSRLGTSVSLSNDGSTMAAGAPSAGSGSVSVYSIDLSSMVIENSFDDAVKVYPNPIEGQLSIAFGQSHNNITAKVFNQLGQVIQTQKASLTNYISLDMDAPTGIYFISISDDKGQTAKVKVVKQ